MREARILWILNITFSYKLMKYIIFVHARRAYIDPKCPKLNCFIQICDKKKDISHM